MAASRRAGGVGGIGAVALADLLGHWPTADGPLYRLLAARIARLADTGELSAGLRLPPERDLAAALSVSRNTVAAAYQVLRDEGMAESRQGAGTRIVPHRTTPAAVHRANGFFAGLLENSVLDADLTLAAVDCAPQVAAALAEPASVLGGTEPVTASSGYFPLGLPALRVAIASHLTHRLGLPADPAEVIVTTGGQQALDLLIRCEVLPGQPVVVEDPTFPGALDALYRAGARVLGIPAGAGLDPDRLEHVVRTHRPAMVYLIPTHHNPTGLVMPAGYRRRVTRLAAAYPDTLFVDDMTMAELPLGDNPAPLPLAALDPGQPNLVSVGSLSKLYWGGLRTGWIRASAGLIARVAAAKAAADLGGAAFPQAIAAALLNDQHDDIVKWRREWLRARHDALAGALRTALPEWTWPEPDGGLTLWVRLPRLAKPADSSAFAQAALRHGVAVVPGRLLSANAGPASGTAGASREGSGQASEYLRLAFTQPPDVLARSAVALARASGLRLHQGCPDQPVPRDQRGELVGAELPGPGRPDREHHVAGLRGRVPDRDLHLTGQLQAELGEHRTRLPHRPRPVGEALVPARRGPEQRHRVAGAERADDHVVRGRGVRHDPQRVGQVAETHLLGGGVAVRQQQVTVLRVGPGAGDHPGAVHRRGPRVEPGQEVVHLVVAGQPGRDQPFFEAPRPRGDRKVIMPGQGRTPTGRRSRRGRRAPTGRRLRTGPRSRSPPAAGRCRGRCRRALPTGRWR
jgi:DNA-binding transcriptional MocR family regulator